MVVNLHAQDTQNDAGTPASDTTPAPPPNSDSGWRGKLTPMIWALVGVILTLALRDPLLNFFRNRLHPWLTQGATRILIRWGGYSRLLKAYHRGLQRRLQQVRLTKQVFAEGVDLDRHYIPIQLSQKEFAHPVTVPGGDTPRSEAMPPHSATRTDVRVEVEDALTEVHGEAGNRTVIIGEPGAGKTTLLNYLAYQCTKGEGVKPIPVLITLNVYASDKAKRKVKTIPAYIEAIFAENGFPRAKDYILTDN